jgi:putative ABC transport system substrate-binding protein
MRRREFIAGIGSVAAWQAVARAQQPAMPVTGYLDSSPIDVDGPFVTAFRQGLSDVGYIEGRNVAIEYRSAMGQYDRLPSLATGLAQRRVAVIAATGVSLSALAAKAATATIPIVFSLGGDPVRLGLVSSLNKPGGNVTGVTYLVNELGAKRLQLFRSLVPQAANVAVLINPRNPNAEADLEATRAAAHALGLTLIVSQASTETEIDAAFASFLDRRPDALFVSADRFFADRGRQLASLATRHSMPLSVASRSAVTAGALMMYGDDRSQSLRQFGAYAGRVLKGDKPADLPVIQPSKFDFAINLKTAKALGLTVPEQLLATADEVIQ